MNKERTQGFMLLEVMMSVAILLSAAVILSGVFGQSLRQTQASAEGYRMALRFESKLWEFDHGGRWTEEAPADGGFAARWTSADSSERNEGWAATNLAVLWKRGRRTESLQMVAYELK